MAYMSDLRSQLKRAEKRAEEAFKNVQKSPSIANINAYINAYNNAQVDVRTVQSRIDNYGKSSPVMMEYVMPSSQKVY